MMDDVNSIERYRKRRKRNRNRKRFFTLLVLIAIAMVLYFTSDMWMNLFNRVEERITEIDGSTTQGFPISLRSSAGYDMQPMGSSIAVLTDTYILSYSNTGKREISQQHTYSNPYMQVSNRRILLYDKGAYNFLVRSKSTEVYSKTLSEKIILARISGKDYVAVVTESTHYNAQMAIYNNRGDEIFTWYSDYKILDVEFTSDSKGAIVSTITSNEGEFLTKLYRFDFSSEEVVWTTDIAGSMVFSLGLVENGNIIAAGDNAIIQVDSDGQISHQHSFTTDIARIAKSDATLTLELEDSNSRGITILSAGKDTVSESNKHNIDGQVKDLYADSDSIYLLTSNMLYVYSIENEPLAELKLEQEYEQIITLDDYCYLLRDRNIVKISKKEVMNYQSLTD